MKRAIVFLFFSGLPVVSCGPYSPFASEPQHAVGHPIRTLNPLDWMEKERGIEHFQTVVAPMLGTDGVPAEFYPDDHPDAAWAQAEAARLHSLLGSRLSGPGWPVPTPVVRIWKNPKTNGMAIPGVRCAEAQVRVAALSPDVGNYDESNKRILSQSVSGIFFEAPDNACEHTDTVDLRWVVDWFSRNRGYCSVYEERGSLVVDSACRLSPPLRRLGQGLFARVLVTSTSPVVLLTSGLFAENRGRDWAIVTLTHELGHYYRSHPALSTTRYNTYYDQRSYGESGRPKDDPSLQELGDRLLRAARSSATPDAEVAQLRAEAQERAIGVYTFEQEADDLALEFLGLLGYERSLLVDKMFAALKDRHAPEHERWGALTYEPCRVAYANGWRDSAGSPIYVPVGDWSDPHHSLCYRIYNASHELRRHGW